ncbi:hypothetical protein IW140_002243 [Coemansia sp. RSA 1813]|nr:hypothetical protein EV178_001752 [Coemansia sp. RSA 1646]KAJ1770527.1 hypothetical protein LPJ74_003131 [Coemansia sp. RSA 1843]KAJ2092935.1 hypothetical protein IW138_000648 [Coemansia sp. RSA 986]KAJ2216256.1 hypothetical protein EV179_001494 [Coemansia sp. RSA 487]KAJ2570571.1 hypothetical protein IW140_002243 [Coemansia sp. RSA 1813]
MSTTPNGRKRGTPSIVVVPDMQLQTPGTARVAGLKDEENSAADSRMNHASDIMRAQLRGPKGGSLFGGSDGVHGSNSNSGGGSPVPLSTPRTIEHFRLLQSGAATVETMPPTPPPSSWHESLTDFLARFCSPHRFGLESMTIWHDEVAKIKIPTASAATATAAATSSSSNTQPAAATTAATSPIAAGLTREQWIEAEGYITYLAQQLTANNPLTGNLHWAMVHFLVQMRCLKTVDFLAPIDPALRNLHFILRLVFKGLCLAVDDTRMRKLFADRPIASGTVDLIIDKVGAYEDGEVRTHAFKLTLADTRKLHCQLLEYVVLAVARLDVQTSQSAYLFYLDLLAMLLDLFIPQVYARTIDSPDNTLAHELMATVGNSATFNVSSVLAEEAVRALIQSAVDAPQPSSSGHGLVFSAYSFLFSRSGTSQSKSLEQHALLLLLLLASQPDISLDERNPYVVALEKLDDSPKDPLVSNKSISFRKIFTKIVSELHTVEWTTLLHVLIMRNEAFRTYVLARTDTDTLLIPLLKRVSLATAMSLTSTAPQTTAATSASATMTASQASLAGAGTPSHGHASGFSKRHGDRHGGLATYPSGNSARTSESTGSGDAKTQRHSRRMSQSSSSTSSQPSPAIPSLTYSATSGGGTANSLTTSSNIALGAKLRQGSLLPYALTPDTVPYAQLYLWMGTILSLTEDAQFVEQLRRTTIDFWPTTPAPMHKQPLSHCIAVESMRIFQLNIMQLKDKHLHDLALGTLVNVLYNTTGISAAISQKLVKLFEMIHRRFVKLSSNLSDLSYADHKEHDVYAQTLTILLALFYHLLYTNNSHFIYGLLQANAVLGGFRESKKEPRNGEIQTNALLDRAVQLAAKLRVRVAYFHARIAALTSPQANDILELVESVINGENNQGKPSSVSFTCKVSSTDGCWSAFMLPLVWELLLSSNIATIGCDGSHPLLEEFENMVL